MSAFACTHSPSLFFLSSFFVSPPFLYHNRYEAMNNANYLNARMITILNDNSQVSTHQERKAARREKWAQNT